MLTKIREKTQGAFAAVILLMIAVPFALWGINNYLDGGREPVVASVGSKEFYQRDVLRAYEQYSQELRGLGIDEAQLKAQALDKLIQDEVLLQYVHARGLAVTDEDVRTFIKTLPYFQTDGAYAEEKYRAFLAAQRMTSADFVDRVRQGMRMQQLQDGVVNSSFATTSDVERFFAIQNQQRSVEYLTIPVQKVSAQLSDEQIAAYYQQHQAKFETPEQVSVAYVELLLTDMAKKTPVTEDSLKAFYEAQKSQYSTPERRKISHILFLVNAQNPAEAALAKAEKAKQAVLANRDFAQLAAELSEDTITAKQGGDLGLFTPGVMEPAFDKAALALKQGEVSEPVRSAFGYHLIKVTELTPETVKTFAEVRDELLKEYQKNQAETAFYELAERLSGLSFEHPDTLQTVAETLAVPIKKTAFFTLDQGEGLAANEKVRAAAFTDEVRQGNNSEVIELEAGHVVVLRQVERKPAAVKPLSEVKAIISAALIAEQTLAATQAKTEQIKAAAVAGQALSELASTHRLILKQAKALQRRDVTLPPALLAAIFRAAKPAAEKPSYFAVPLPTGEQVLVRLTEVVEGVMSEQDKKAMDLALQNLGQAWGQAEFNALLGSLKAGADIDINLPPIAAAEQP